MAKESPEEKLLKMMKKSLPSVAAKPSAISPLKKFKFTFSIDVLNIFLFLGIILCALALVIELFSGSSSLNQGVKILLSSKKEMSLSNAALPAIPTTDYYLEQINERNIFKPYVPKTAVSTEKSLAQQMSRYKLVGIAWLDLPETASIMINDTQKNKTIFLMQGQQLEGITVKTIYTDRAVFSDGNQETTIKL